ncbi:TonB-dependent receptor [Bowmanella denitrificans]|uniref:TonB-dependent receptor n=1 Tax=Bowmanella denitrificans TaxID=366582 RepID=UPI000C9B4485|nr:TonB-dependent receptor [Bowmanella denitrificans]
MTGKQSKLGYLPMMVMINMGVITSMTAQAQNSVQVAEDEPVEVISVRGIKGSLIRSMDIKRESGNVVDAITAEDIGKFPDQNVAESLQRITGVAIDREGGEGQLVSVRGLGPEFNSVLVNGRTMASISGGRAFSFDTLASELISGAEVHKTSYASHQEGSIGALVNVTTLRPFDIDGFKASGSIKGVYDDMTGSTKPQLSGLISNTFADDTLGVLLSFSHNERKSRYDSAQTFGYLTRDITLDDGSAEAGVLMPRNYDQISQTETRDRTGGTLVLQYRASDNLVLTADALYSKYDVDYRQDILAHWFDNSQITDAELDSNRTLVKLSMGRGSNTDYLNRLSQRPTETKAFGFNAKWQVNDSLELTGDIFRSEAESNGGGRTTDTVASYQNNYTFDNSAGAELPSIQFDKNLSTDGVKAGWGSRFGSDIADEITEAKLQGEWAADMGVLAKVKFGTTYYDRTLSSRYAESAWQVSVLYGDNPTPVLLPSSMFSKFDGGFLSGATGNPPQEWLTFNSEDFFNYLLSDAAIAQLDDPAAGRQLIEEFGGYTAHPSNSAYEINESGLSFYTDFFFEGELGEMFWSLNAGLRYVQTDNASRGQQLFLLDLLPLNNGQNEVQPKRSEDYLPIEVEHEYNNLLPSLNASLEIRDDLIARFSYSQSITRPELGEMSPVTNYGGGKVDALNASGGNPKLKPFESDNLDLTLEWYYSEGSYAAVAMFRKDIDNYVDWGITDETVTVPSGTYQYKVGRPVNLNSARIDGYELAVQHLFSNLPAPFDGLGVIANMTFVDSESSSDDPANPLPLVGLGDSQNLILFYEQGPFQFRVAYNNRNEFMQSKENGYGGAPIYVDDYAQVDISGSYDINDDLTVFFEGINITNELTRKRGLYENHILNVIETGPRYALGVRATF